MALTSTIEIADQNIKNTITSLKWGIKQKVLKGLSQGDTHHKEINFLIRNIDNSVFYYDWAKDKSQVYNATITFDNNDGKKGILSTLKLTDAICSGFTFAMDEDDEKEITLLVTLSPKKVEYV